MTAKELLQAQWARIYPMLEMEIADLTLEELKHTFPGSTIGSILGTYVHTILGEDFLIMVMAAGGAHLWNDEWSARTGLTIAGANPDPAQVAAMTAGQWAAFREFAAAVQAAAQAWLAAASDADLAREVDVFFMKRTMSVAEMLGTVSFFHTLEHAAEISALRGVMGKSGMRG
jgi:hypothetical protein